MSEPYDFNTRATSSLATQCRLQGRVNLDPELTAFMEAVADRLETLSGPGAVMPTASIHDALPPRRPFTGPWDFVVRAHRPIGLWIGILILFVHGVVIPIAALCGRLVVGFNAVELLGICGLVGLGWHQRTKEKQEGLTS